MEKVKRLEKALCHRRIKNYFLWRKKDLFCIEILYPDLDDQSNWLEIRYDFCEIQTDYGAENALIQLDNEGRPRKVFGLMNVPLSYRESIEK